jgi:hypothetical protein
MDTEEINEALILINSFHHTFDEKNPITYQILMTEYKEQLSSEQIVWIRDRIQHYQKIKAKTDKKIMEYIDNEISRLPLSEKLNEKLNECKILNQ